MNTTTQHAEVIVVGGGQAGMAAGYYLAQAGGEENPGQEPASAQATAGQAATTGNMPARR